MITLEAITRMKDGERLDEGRISVRTSRLNGKIAWLVSVGPTLYQWRFTPLKAYEQVESYRDYERRRGDRK